MLKRVIGYLIIFGAIIGIANRQIINKGIISNVSRFGTTVQVEKGAKHSQQNTSVPLEGYKWPSKDITIAVTSTDPRTIKAFNDAINAWNSTGTINFVRTDHDQNADIVANDTDLSADDQSNGIVETEELGVTSASYNRNTKILNHATSSIDINKLANSSEQYRMWVAEHELGHAIGLAHAKENDDSVMVPINPKTGITSNDINSVKELYDQK